MDPVTLRSAQSLASLSQSLGLASSSATLPSAEALLLEARAQRAQQAQLLRPQPPVDATMVNAAPRPGHDPKFNNATNPTSTRSKLNLL